MLNSLFWWYIFFMAYPSLKMKITWLLEVATEYVWENLKYLFIYLSACKVVNPLLWYFFMCPALTHTLLHRNMIKAVPILSELAVSAICVVSVWAKTGVFLPILLIYIYFLKIKKNNFFSLFFISGNFPITRNNHRLHRFFPA